jgi:hypothetical protein
LQRVPDPGGKDGAELVGVDWRKIAGRYRGAWLKGNRRIVKARECDDTQADKLAKGGR